jgi:hypothetical protein
LADAAVAGPPASVHRFGQFLIGHVGEPHRHADLAAETDREPDILEQKPQDEIGRVVLARQKPAEPIKGVLPAASLVANFDPIDLIEADLIAPAMAVLRADIVDRLLAGAARIERIPQRAIDDCAICVAAMVMWSSYDYERVLEGGNSI